jgi:membrane protein YqaA with SNARE-associated domain
MRKADDNTVHAFFNHFIGWLFHLGALGLVILGVLDSSFLFLPLGNDLLLVGLTVQHHDQLPYYVSMAAVGSTAGCLLLDLVARKGGEEGLKKMMKPQRLEYLKKRIGDRAAVALAVACLAPPPFPFTAVVAAASALNYPRPKLLSVIVAGRGLRFTIVGFLAIWFGRRILAIAKSSAFEWSMIVFIAICAVGSAISIRKWLARSKRA